MVNAYWMLSYIGWGNFNDDEEAKHILNGIMLNLRENKHTNHVQLVTTGLSKKIENERYDMINNLALAIVIDKPDRLWMINEKLFVNAVRAATVRDGTEEERYIVVNVPEEIASAARDSDDNGEPSTLWFRWIENAVKQLIKKIGIEDIEIKTIRLKGGWGDAF